jgi:hypothetical protein
MALIHYGRGYDAVMEIAGVFGVVDVIRF